jgi:uncharacterized membrane protein YhhN
MGAQPIAAAPSPRARATGVPVGYNTAVTSAAWVLLAVAAGVALVDWWAVATRTKRVEYIAKPAVLAVLVALALVVDPTYGDRRTWFVVALVCSLVGDVFLMLPQDLFVPGLVSFLLAHVAYTIGFDLHQGSVGALIVATLVVVTLDVVVGSRILGAIWRGDDAALRGPVVVYMVVISAMVVSALTAGPWLGAAGAVLFFSSDTLIAWDRFVQPRRWMPLAIIVTYHLGQGALVCSLVR